MTIHVPSFEPAFDWPVRTPFKTGFVAVFKSVVKRLFRIPVRAREVTGPMAAGKAVFLRGTAGGFLRLVHADAVTVCHTVVLSPADTDAESGMDWDVVRHVKTGKVADVVTGGDCETLAKGVGRGAIPGMGVCRS